MTCTTILPVITLWQPFASLIFAEGRPKKHETRSFRYPARLEGERIAIHAAKAFPAWRHISSDLHDLCLDTFGCQYHETLPLGALIGTVILGGCAATTDMAPDEDDRIAGNWEAGRFAWRLTDVQVIDGHYLPMRGRQGWWSVSKRDLIGLPLRVVA